MGKCQAEGNSIEKDFIKSFALFSILLLGFLAGIIIIVDPFFHYHKPWLGLKPVYTQKKEYQITGVIDHFDYNSVLAGSSEVINMNSGTLDEKWGCKTVKAVGNNASTELLCAYLNRAFSKQELEYVFYGYDVFALYNEVTGEPLTGDGLEYMRNKNPLDDVSYFWNKDILGIDVPYMIFKSYKGDVDEGAAYSFAQYWTFGKEEVFKRYHPEAEIKEMKPETESEEIVRENLELIKEVVENHPDTEFKFFLPPYSVLWWDESYRLGMTDSYFYALELSMKELLPYENVEFYATDFNNRDVIENLDNYMDSSHASLEINEKMAQYIGEKENQLTLENYKYEIDKMRTIIEIFEERLSEEGWENYILDLNNGEN